MDDATAHKIRGLKLKILHVEKELAATHHNAELGQWLRAGRSAQMAKASERERIRLETKLDDLKARLAALTSEGAAPAPLAAPAPVEPAPKPKAAKKTAATKAAAAPKTARKTTKK